MSQGSEERVLLYSPRTGKPDAFTIDGESVYIEVSDIESIVRRVLAEEGLVKPPEGSVVFIGSDGGVYVNGKRADTVVRMPPTEDPARPADIADRVRLTAKERQLFERVVLEAFYDVVHEAMTNAGMDHPLVMETLGRLNATVIQRLGKLRDEQEATQGESSGRPQAT